MSNDLLTHPNEHVISTLEPDIHFQNSVATLSFYISDAVTFDEVETLEKFIDKVTDPETVTEVTLNIDVKLENIPDYFLEVNCECGRADEDGLYHMDEEDRPQVEMVREGLLKALAKLDNVRYHKYENQ